MKKITAILLTIMMIAALVAIPVSVSAAPGNDNFGNVKKISDSDINMANGDRDAAWDFALAIPVNVGSATATGTTWVLWSDTAYYFYTEVNDPTPINVDLSDWTDGDYFDAWITDSVEIFISVDGVQGDIDAKTVGNYDDACWQYRIDRSGLPSSYQRAGAWTDDFMCGVSVNKGRFEWAAKQDGNKYYTKHKITMLSAPKAGEMGMSVQINDLEEEGGGVLQNHANDTDSWTTDMFGYVVLVDEPAIIADPAPASGAKLAGSLIGAEGGWEGNPDTGRNSAFDGNPGTFYDPAAKADPAHYVGIKVSEPYVLTEIHILPRNGFLDRFKGASIWGFNGDTFDPETATQIWVSGAGAAENAYQVITADQFIAGANIGFTNFAYFNTVEHGDVAEVALYGAPGSGDAPAPAPTPTPAPATPSPAVPTGDSGIIILVTVMIIAAAGVVVFRKQSAK